MWGINRIRVFRNGRSNRTLRHHKPVGGNKRCRTVSCKEVTDTNATPNLERGMNSITDFSPNEERDACATAKPKFCARERAKPGFLRRSTN